MESVFVCDKQSAPEATCGNFSDGLASVNTDNGAKFIDKNGNIVIKTDFAWASDFKRGAARVEVVKGDGSHTYGYIDRSRRIIWTP